MQYQIPPPTRIVFKKAIDNIDCGSNFSLAISGEWLLIMLISLERVSPWFYIERHLRQEKHTVRILPALIF